MESLRILLKKVYEEISFDVNGCHKGGVPRVLSVAGFPLRVCLGLILTILLGIISLCRPVHILLLKKGANQKVSLFVNDIEGYLRHVKNKKVIVLVPFVGEFPSAQLGKMYQRNAYFVRNRFGVRALKFTIPVLRLSKSRAPDLLSTSYLSEWKSPGYWKVWNSVSNILNFSEDEIVAGKTLEEKLFQDSKKPFVMLSVGSRKYREVVDKVSGKELESNLTHCDLGLYFPAITYLVNAGFEVVRFGTHLIDPLPTDLGPSVHDYGLTGRSSFGDVWLNSRCAFNLAGVTGGWWFANIFARPSVLTNSPYCFGSSSETDLFIPCMPWLVAEGRFASFEWQMQNKNWSLDLDKLGNAYVAVRNNPTEIISVAEEMVNSVNGRMVLSNEDLELQKRFKSLQDRVFEGSCPPSRIGIKFLREHQNLLPQ